MCKLQIIIRIFLSFHMFFGIVCVCTKFFFCYVIEIRTLYTEQNRDNNLETFEQNVERENALVIHTHTQNNRHSLNQYNFFFHN